MGKIELKIMKDEGYGNPKDYRMKVVNVMSVNGKLVLAKPGFSWIAIYIFKKGKRHSFHMPITRGKTKRQYEDLADRFRERIRIQHGI